ncbi:MAG: hypothetical protein RL660_550 [Bacteroidota bacterium]|jgi:hypothetical protein
MSKKLQILTILLIAFTVNGCTSMIGLIYGIKKSPTIQTKASIRSFIEKHHYDSSSQYYLLSYSALRQLTELTGTANAILIFDQNGFCVGDSIQRACNGTMLDLIDSTCSLKATKAPSCKFTLDSLRSNLIKVYPSIADSNFLSGKPTVVLFWATYLGRYNSSHYFKYVKQLQKSKHRDSINLVSVSLDFFDTHTKN